MANSVEKRLLSASTDGAPIKIAATASSGTLIHTATASTTTVKDEVWIWLMNTHTASQSCTIQFGGTASPDNEIVVTVPSRAGLALAIPGFVLQNAKEVRAFASQANTMLAVGFVNRITNS